MIIDQIGMHGYMVAQKIRDINQVRRDLRSAYKRLKKRGGWRSVGREFGITGGMAFRIAMRRYEPRDPVIRTRLGLPAYVEVPVCPKCGVVHVKKGCSQANKNHRKIWDMSIDELRWALENRVEVHYVIE